MTVIEQTRIYSRKDLQELLEPFGINADTFVARIRPKKVFRKAWFGQHLIEALAEAPALAGTERDSKPQGGTAAAPRGQGRPSSRQRTTTRLEASLEPLKALARESHERSSD